jgi:uncharacterized protein YjbJ (UPF0337 family)
MDREHVRGTADKAKGAIKDTASKVTGDKKLESEGKLDKAKGYAADLKDAVKQSNKSKTTLRNWPPFQRPADLARADCE